MTPMYADVSCPLCGAAAARPFLDRASVPVHQNLVAATAAEARGIARGRLAMQVCHDCGFVFNGAFEPSLMSYGDSYDNTQTYSPRFDEHVRERIEWLVRDRGARDCTVVEVGCGKGHFLRRLVEYPGANIRGVGFDPTYVGPDSDLEGRLRFERRFYDDQASAVPADIVVCRHVLEHVPRPLELLGAVRRAVASRPDALICFETPCVEWILRNRVWWDFFYEHCSLFTSGSLASAFGRAGFGAIGVTHVFGGQYLWLESRATGERRDPPEEGDIPELAHAIGGHEQRLVRAWEQMLAGADAAGGRVAVWGAGAKGATFANLVDPGCERIHCFVDVNPHKQGSFVAGTGHRIVGPDMLARERITTAVVLNPNYVAEVAEEVRRRGAAITIIDLMRALDEDHD